MSALWPHIRTLRALGAALHRHAELRMPREGKSAPATPFPDKPAALLLGSMAQALEDAADELEAGLREMVERVAGQPTKES